MVFVNTVREHMFVNSVRVPGSWINLDRVLLMQPICFIDLVHMNIYKIQKSIHIHRKYTHLTWAQGPARGPCKVLHFLCICLDFCIFVYIHMYQIYIVQDLSTIWQLCVHYLSTNCPILTKNTICTTEISK